MSDRAFLNMLALLYVLIIGCMLIMSRLGIL